MHTFDGNLVGWWALGVVVVQWVETDGPSPLEMLHHWPPLVLVQWPPLEMWHCIIFQGLSAEQWEGVCLLPDLQFAECLPRGG